MDRETLTRAGKVGSTRCLLMVGANLLANNHRVTAKRRLRRHSLASSVGSGSLVGGCLPDGTRAGSLFGPSLPPLERGLRAEEGRCVTLEDVKGLLEEPETALTILQYSAGVAVRHITTGLLEKMKTSTTVTFDEFYR